MNHTVKIKSISQLTHDVFQIVVNKPEGYDFTPGQATDVSINAKGWRSKKRSFTFTSLPYHDSLEFVIKTYPTHQGVTNQFLKLKANDELILHDVFGDIAYKGEGIFIAGGAGITPFISILRQLKAKNEVGNNKLIFANKTRSDIILEDEFKKLLGKNFINVLSDEAIEGNSKGFITSEIIKDNIESPDTYFYVCGPPPMMNAIEDALLDLHIDKKWIIKEAF